MQGQFRGWYVKVDGKNVLMDNGKVLEYQPLEVKQNLTNSPYV